MSFSFARRQAEAYCETYNQIWFFLATTLGGKWSVGKDKRQETACAVRVVTVRYNKPLERTLSIVFDLNNG
jgi:hypothetical protein